GPDMVRTMAPDKGDRIADSAVVRPSSRTRRKVVGRTHRIPVTGKMRPGEGSRPWLDTLARSSLRGSRARGHAETRSVAGSALARRPRRRDEACDNAGTQPERVAKPTSAC